MEKNKVISKLCCLETTFYIVFLTILILHYKKGLENRTFALLIFLSFLADDTLDVGVMMFDLNNLKEINDTYGHEEGDLFIQTFASYLTRILTENSFLARFGGDEFVIIQRETSWSEL